MRLSLVTSLPRGESVCFGVAVQGLLPTHSRHSDKGLKGALRVNPGAVPLNGHEIGELGGNLIHRVMGSVETVA